MTDLDAIDLMMTEILSQLDLQSISLFRTGPSSDVEEIISIGRFPKSVEESHQQIFSDATEIRPSDVASKVGIFKLPIISHERFAYAILCYRISAKFRLFTKINLSLISDLESLLNLREIEYLAARNSELEKELSLVSRSANAILEGFETESARAAFEVTLEYLLHAFSLEHGSIWELHDEEYFTLEATVNSPVEEYKRNSFKKSCGLVSRAVVSGAPKVQKFRLEGDMPPHDLENKKMFEYYKGRDIHLIRLGPDAKPYGVACLVGDAPTPLGDAALDTVEQLLAIELSSRRKDVTNRLFKSVQSLFKHNEQTVIGICNFIVAQVVQIVNCQAATIVLKELLEPSSSRMQVIASKVADEFVPSKEILEFQEGKKFYYDVNTKSITGKIAHLQTEFLSNEVSKNSVNSFTFCEVQDRSNDTWMGVPILTAADECLGVLRCRGKLSLVGSKKCDYIFDRLDLELLINAASILAPLLQHKVSANELKSINERLAQADRIREHEMRGPLQLIGSQAVFVLRHLEDVGVTSKPRRVESIITNVELCSALLTSTTLPNEAKFITELQPLNLRKMILSIVEVIRHQIDSRSPSQIVPDPETGDLLLITQPYIIVEFNGQSPSIIGHRDLLQRAIYNIANNAVKYANPQEKGRIIIELKSEIDGWVKIICKDFGIGVAPKDSSKIFEGIFRGENAQNRPGEGLGLKIARSILHLHQGSLELTTCDNPTQFELLIPINMKK